MAAGDLTSKANVRAYLGIVDVTWTEDDTLIDRLVTAASARFKKETGRDILTASYTDNISGTNTFGVTLRNTPVISVSSVVVDGEAIPVQTVVGGDGHVLTGNRVELVSYVFTVGVKNVSIAYSAGYGATAPFDVEQAVIEIVGDTYKKRDRLGQMSRGINGESITFQVLSLPISVSAVIDTYRRRAI